MLWTGIRLCCCADGRRYQRKAHRTRSLMVPKVCPVSSGGAHETKQDPRNPEKLVSAVFHHRRATSLPIWPAHARSLRVWIRRRRVRTPCEALAFAPWFGTEGLLGSHGGRWRFAYCGKSNSRTRRGTRDKACACWSVQLITVQSLHPERDRSPLFKVRTGSTVNACTARAMCRNNEPR
jgi:hypothetical protein